MGHAGLIEFRRDHPDIVGQRPTDFGANVEPLRMDAIIIGDQDTHDRAAENAQMDVRLALNEAQLTILRLVILSSSLLPYRVAARLERRSSRPAAGRSPSPR